MTFYTNHTRHTSVLTVKISAANDLKTAVTVGVVQASAPHDVALGYNDIVVPAGETVSLADETDAAFIGVRAGD